MPETVDDTSSSNLDLDNITDLMNRSEYDKVIFHDVADSYATDNDIECRYTLTPSVVPKEGDKIALFKVGWESPNVYLTYEKAKIPENSEHSSELSVIFKAEVLPKDDEVFYQFCYLCADGVVKGASTPFQFRHPVTEELVEIEDTENDLLIIRTRTAVFEERLREVAFKNNVLAKAKESLERLLQEKNEQCEELSQKLKECKNEYAVLQKDTSLAMKQHHENLEKLQNDLDREKHEAAEKIAVYTSQMVQNDAYIEELRSTIKVLSEAKELSEAKAANEKTDKMTVQRNLAIAEENVQKLSKQNEQIKHELDRTIKLAENQSQKFIMQENESHKRVKELKEQLSIVERKLSIAETNVLKLSKLNEQFLCELERTKVQTQEQIYKLTTQEKESHKKEEELLQKISLLEGNLALIQENGRKISLQNEKLKDELEKTLHLTEEQNHKLSAQANHYHQKEKELKEKLSAIERNLALSEENVQKMSKQMEQLKQELEKTACLTEEENIKFTEQAREYQQKEKELKEKLSVVEKNLALAEENVQKLSKRNELLKLELEKTLRVTEEQNHKFTAQFTAQTNEYQQKEVELKEKLSMVEKNLALAEENVQKMSRRNEQLKYELERNSHLTEEQNLKFTAQANEYHQKEKELKEKLCVVEKDKKRLMSQLIDTEHMLAAMEKSKHLATDELMKHSDYKRKVTTELEQAQNRIHKLEKQVKSLDGEKHHLLKEKHQLEKEIHSLKAKCSSLPAGNDTANENKNWESEKENYNLLVTNLRDRLKAGAVEYEAKYIECVKLEKKLGKLKKKLKDKSSEPRADSSEEKINAVSSSSDDRKKKEQEESKSDSSIERLLTEKDLRIKLLEEKIEILSKPTLQSNVPSQNPQVQNVNSKESSRRIQYMYSTLNNLFPGNPYIYQPIYNPPSFNREESIEVNENEPDGVNDQQDVLPPPIQPEVTPLAKLAAVRAVSRHVIDNEPQELPQMETSVLPENNTDPVECDSPENDFFLPDVDIASHDNESTDFLSCPICGMYFDEFSDLHNHVENVHLGLECPVCNKLFQPQEQDNFEFHVQTHFANENRYEIFVD